MNSGSASESWLAEVLAKALMARTFKVRFPT